VSTEGAPRLAPLPRDRWDDETLAAMSAGMPARIADRIFSTEPGTPPVPNVMATFANHPKLAAPLLAFTGVLMNSPETTMRQRELMVLRVGWRTGSTYEWAQHNQLAPKYGITPEELVAVSQGADADCWTPLEKDLLRATDQLVDQFRIDDETWARLAEQLSERQLFEIVFVVGTYTSMAMAFNSFGMQLDAGLRPPALTPPSPVKA
jgi:alkylhydroperoxidase family enzyme